jgi:hypothetical protein
MNRSHTPRSIYYRKILLKLLNRLNLISEYEHLLSRNCQEIIESVDEPMEFVNFLVKYQHCLTNIFIRYVLLSDDYFDRVAQDVSAKFFDAGLESGREKESLAIWSNLRYYGPDLIFKAHIEHLIRFIYNKKRASASEVECFFPNQFNESPWCCDNNFIFAGFNILPEFMLIYSTENRQDIHIEWLAMFSIHFIYLVA